MMIDESSIRQKYLLLKPTMNERSRRLWAAAEARTAGRGGFNAVLRATALSPSTLTRGLNELASGQRLGPGRIRRSGGGRKSAKTLDPGLVTALEALVEPVTRGDPESPLRWTSKSTRVLSAELAKQGHQVSHTLVAQLLHQAGYSLQGNRKTREGQDHPDRDAQFAHINTRMTAQLKRGQPAISVDTKKKELVGNFKNGVVRGEHDPPVVAGHGATRLSPRSLALDHG